jgi:SAM-dependent methyltransferase
VHIDDQMLRSDAPEHLRHYLEDARSAMLNIEESLSRLERTFDDVQACLDFGSGYGRVTRHLVARIPAARVTVCDVDPKALRFRAAEFGVKAVRSSRDVDLLRLSERYDLVFVGSVLTHVPPRAGLALLAVLVGALERRGVLIFSTQGESCLDHLDWYGPSFARAEGVYRHEIERVGVCFLPYPGRIDYGVSIHARWFVEKAMSDHWHDVLRPLRFKERGWDAHQDVWSYARL